MKNLKNILESLWNSKEDSYSESKHPILQKTIDYIKDKYIRLTTKIEKGYYKVRDQNLPLQARIVGHKSRKTYSEKSLI
tara:strand:- start:1686 stop:1922 length:237 start_codon:yes stop_codon:yes gene_type:complete